MMQDTGYYVWNPNERQPSFRHEERTRAIAEAERLAERTGLRFIVLKAIGSAAKAKVAPFIPSDGEGDKWEPPF